jgi:hypothetical protein
MWEENNKEKNVELRWFYYPEELPSGRLAKHGLKEVFESEHIDEQSLDSAVDVVQVVYGSDSYNKIADLSEKKRTFYVSEFYDPLLKGEKRKSVKPNICCHEIQCSKCCRSCKQRYIVFISMYA